MSLIICSLEKKSYDMFHLEPASIIRINKIANYYFVKV